MEKLKLGFYLKLEKTNAEMKSAIYCKLSVNKTSTTFSTGKYIFKERWLETNHFRNVLKNDVEKNIQSYLKQIERKVDEIYLNLIKSGTNEITAEQIKIILLNKANNKEDEKTLIKCIDFHNQYFKKLVEKGEKAKGTLTRFETVKKMLVEYLQIKYKVSDVSLSKLDKNIAEQLDMYLRTQKHYRGKIGSCANNSTVKYIRNIRTIFNFSIRQGWTDINPFQNYTKRLKEVKTIFLEEDELERIENKVFEIERLNNIKNIFLFSCLTGYAPVDVMKLRWCDVITRFDEKWIKTDRIKTDTLSDIPLLPLAEKIINHYKNDPRCVDEERLLPRISNCKMNAYLKEIADLCGINKNLTWYVSRHTFGTTVTLNNDVPLEVVSSMLGHKSLKQTKHYAKIIGKTVSRHMKQLKSKYV